MLTNVQSQNMKNLTGKTLVFTDFHIGLAGNKESRLKICIEVTKQLLKQIKTSKIDNVLFCGDWHHSRTTLDSNALNVSYRLVSAIAKCARCILICGNHDIYLKNSTDINSINIFKDIPNVELVTKTQEVMMNNSKCLLVPWLGDTSACKKEDYDFLFGHFDISSKYLIASYVAEHSRDMHASNNASAAIDSDDLLRSSYDKSMDLVGDFVELAKKSGTVFAGHIHKHKEFMSKGRKFIFVGSPYQQTLGDIGNECGYYVIDEDNKYKFIEIDCVPKHVKLMMSDVIKQGINNFDFSIVKGNIVQKVYDIDVKQADESAIVQKINDFKPYEELVPDYQVAVDLSGKNRSADEKNSVELLKKSKLDYVKHYIDCIDQKVLDENKIDRDKLFEVLSEYYKRAIGE